MTHFLPALAGGLLIGLAAVLLLLFNGRIAGVSGIAGGLLAPEVNGTRLWRVLFLLWLVLGAWGAVALGAPHAPPRQGFPIPLLVIAGLITGYGTSMAGGCTSGHGVCGLARLSKRSLAATCTFVGVAMFTTFVVRHVWGAPA
jgi:uncharacterized protein